MLRFISPPRAVAALLAAFVMLLLTAQNAWAATLTVGPSGTHPTIQAAIDAAADGDVIKIQLGTYAENLTIAKDVTLQGGYDATFSDTNRTPRTTIVDGTATGCPALAVNYSCPNITSASFIPPISADALFVTVDGVEITGGTDSGIVVVAPEDSRITLTNNLIRGNDTTAGASGSQHGAGARILLDDRTHLIMTGNVITGNVAADHGGGLYVQALQVDGGTALSQTVVLSANQFVTNTARNGGGAYLNLVRLADVQIDGNHFGKNRALDGSGAIYLRLEGNSQGGFTGNTLVENVASYNTGEFDLEENVKFFLDSNHIAGNIGQSGAGGLRVDAYENVHIQSHQLTADNNKGQGAALYFDLEDGSTLTVTQAITVTRNRSTGGTAGVGLEASYNSHINVERLYAEDNACTGCSGGGFRVDSSYYGSSVEIGEATVISNTGDSGGGGYIYIYDGTSFKLRQGRFEDNSADYGGGLYVASSSYGSELYLTHVDFISNTATNGSGGGLYLGSAYDGVTRVVEDNSFVGNRANSGGGAHISSDFAEDCVEARFNRNTFINNYALSGDGGGLHGSSELVEGCSLEFKDNIFHRNHASSNGGGASIWRFGYEGSNVTVTGNQFTENFAGQQGGGLKMYNALYEGDTLTMTHNTFAGNTAQNGGGGGVYMDDLVENGIGTFAHNVIVDNMAGGDGGGIRMDEITYEGTTVWFQNNIISRNTISNTWGDGGGLRLYGTYDGDVLWFTGNVITGNVAPGEGGGLFWQQGVRWGGRVTMAHNDISDNVAGTGGGGCYFDNSIEDGAYFRFANNRIANNRSLEEAGGCFIYRLDEGTSFYLHDNEFLNNEAAADGGAWYVRYLSSGGVVLDMRRNDFINNRAGYSATVATGGNFGAIYIRDDNGTNRVNLVANLIQGNHAYADGAVGGHYGALFLEEFDEGSLIQLQDNIIQGNHADQSMGGAVVQLHAARLVADGNVIVGNLATGVGSGLVVSATADGEAFFLHNEIRGNQATEMAGLSLLQLEPSAAGEPYAYAANNLIAGNSQGLSIADIPFYSINDTIAHNGGAGVNITGDLAASVHLSNTIVWGNSSAVQVNFAPTQTVSANYSTIQGGLAGTANLASDPLFVNVGAGDFRLQATSLAVDSADTPSAPVLDLDSIVRPVNTVADRGAYEWHLAGVVLDVSTNIGSIQPGVTATFFLTVTNNGNVPDTFLVDVPVNPLGWPVSLGLQTAATTPLQVTLNPNESGVVEIQVTVPPNAIGGTVNEMVVQVKSQQFGSVVDTATLSVMAAKVADVQLAPNNSGETTTGSQISYVHTLTNVGNFTDTITLSASSSQGWSVVAAPVAVTLAPGASTTVRVTVTVPANAGGKVDVTTLTATSEATVGTITSSATDTTSVPRTVGVQVTAGSIATTNPATPVSFTHRVTNTGNAPDLVALTYGVPAGWTVSGPASVNLNAGQGANIVVQVTPAASAAGQLQLTTVTATSTANPTVFANAQNSIQVAGVGLHLLPNNHGYVRPSATVVYSHTLVNTGESLDTFALSYASSAGWSVEGPDSVQVAPGGSQVVEVRVTMPYLDEAELDVTTVTATSTLDEERQATATNTTQRLEHQLFMPSIRLDQP